ncbi:MAG TPA: hypothetical protein DCZ95_11735 [Verrucomicrobia bacterium]|nr:MAG: hypothetical protein A2X46_01690 [Lentisphaerae bacterium GWF2_57_35]HBA84756.1 hypothetical protein [Verrucomicrobiota bacterium]
MDKTDQIFQTLDKVRNLPTLPIVIQQLRKAVADPNTDASRIAKIIQDDPSMMARILKVVNSVLYGASVPINSLQMAVARMGLNAVNNIAMSTSVFSTFSKVQQTDFNREEFWRHCISTGIACSVLYERCKPNLTKRYGKDVLHLAGLLHDIGKIIFEQFFHADFIATIRLAEEKRLPLTQAEIDLIGADHSQIGAWLGMKWFLSNELLQVIRWHHDPECADVEHQELVMLCHTANYICNLEKIGNSGDSTAPAFHQNIWQKLGLSVRDISEIVDLVNEQSKHSEVLMSFV